MYRFTFISLMLFVANILGAQPTFNEDIAPIIYEHCTSCHRPGEIGPMPLTKYNQVASWASMIEFVTSTRYMPPWKADPSYNSYLYENYLTDEEIQLIADWVAAGSPEGDPANEPIPPVFPPGSQLGTPDLVLSFAETFEHYGGNEDEYRIFVLPTGLTEDKDIAAIELRPGNTEIVHHALFTYDTSGMAQDLDLEDAQYGYEGFGGFGIPGTFNRQLPGYVPGQTPHYFPDGLGQRLPANSDLLVQMHYAPYPTPTLDSSVVNIFFKDEPVDRYVTSHVMLPFFGTLTNGPFLMFPEEVKTFHGVWEIEEDISMLGIAPHMHLLGQDWTVLALHPNGDTTQLIRIPEWDFNWQGSYYFDRFIPLEAGTEVHAYATYDNTSNNPLNPNNPPQLVSWGEGTVDEMYYLPLMYVPYMAGDESIIFEEPTQVEELPSGIELPVNQLKPVVPNPAIDELNIQFSLAKGNKINLQIFNLSGQLVAQPILNKYYGMGRHTLRMEDLQLEPGLYFLTISSPEFKMNTKFSIIR